ncbi:MAG: tryptophanase [Clostridiales bacterium]|nr:tryptophanase [Clostridiales bacterium]
MSKVKLFSGGEIPVEMHRAYTVQNIRLIPVKERLRALDEAGNCSYNLKSEDVFIDMLTDSGCNAMSDRQSAAFHEADFAYAGGASYYRLAAKIKELLGKDYFLPVHQGRACEHMLAKSFVKPGDFVPTNFHFCTILTQVRLAGGTVVEMLQDKGVSTLGEDGFKGDYDLEKLEKFLNETPSEKVPFLRIEAGTNLIGGQPISMDNINAVSKLARAHGVRVLLDMSLAMDNIHFIRTRDEKRKNMTVREITRELADAADIIYFSGRKLGFARGGGICMNDKADFLKVRGNVTTFEGFPTFGGVSSAELEVMRVGLDDTMDPDVISQGPDFIEYMTEEFVKRGVPVVTPAGGLGCHLDADRFCAHLGRRDFRGAALAAAIYIVSGARGMERGLSSEMPEDSIAPFELVRLAVPRRVYTLSHIMYVIDRVTWLYQHRELIGALRWEDEAQGEYNKEHSFIDFLRPVGDWQEKLAEEYLKTGLE